MGAKIGTKRVDSFVEAILFLVGCALRFGLFLDNFFETHEFLACGGSATNRAVCGYQLVIQAHSHRPSSEREGYHRVPEG